MKKQFVLPVMTVVEMKTNMIATSIQSVDSNAQLFYGGAYNGYARTPGRGFYDWDAGY